MKKLFGSFKTAHRVGFSLALLILLLLPILLTNVTATVDSADASEISYRRVIGQTSVKATSYNTVSKERGMHLGGVHTHKYSNGNVSMYVYDSGNNRILGYLNPDNTNNDRPEKVFGQKNSYTTGECNLNNTNDSVAPSRASLCLNRGAYAISQEEEPRYSTMDTDANGNLYVLDQYNNRVLRFNNPFGSGSGEGDTIADKVWGQKDFVSKICNRGQGYPTFPSTNILANGICSAKNIQSSTDSFLGGSVDVDKWGNLWVSDIVNNRIIRFPFNKKANAPALVADIVIGQPNLKSFANGYNSCDALTAGKGLCMAHVFKVNDITGELFVIHGDLSGNPAYRITVYVPNTSSSNPQSYSYQRQFGLGELNIPRSIVFVNENTFLVGDVRAGQDDRLLYYSRGGKLLSIIDNSKIQGQSEDSDITLTEVNGEISISDNYLYITEQRTHNSVLIFNISKLRSEGIVTFVGETLGGANQVWNSITNKNLASPFGIAYSLASQQLYVSDGYRILVWNRKESMLTGRNANFVIGQNNFADNSPTTSTVFKDKVAGLGVDDANNKLWVARGQEIFAFDLPISANNPNYTVRFVTRVADNPTYPGNIKVEGIGKNLIFNAWTVGYNKKDNTLWIVDSMNSRVVRVNEPYTNPKANLFLGQANINGTQCNRGNFSQPTDNTLCNPSSIAFDSRGNVYIAEGVYEGRADRPGNKRIIEFDRKTISAAVSAGVFSQPSADRVYAAPNFTTNPIYDKSGCLTDTPCNPISIGIDEKDRMIVTTDAYFNNQNKRIFIYSNPVRIRGYVKFNPATDIIIKDSIGQGGAISVDYDNGVYIQDHTWNRVMYIKFGN
jgi:hypothetical protein